jgi:DNA polymerase-3 subunit alpha
LEPIDRLASRLDEGEGTVSVVVMLKEREVKVRLPGQYRVTPQVAGAIKAVPGIVHVEMQ